MKDDKIEIYLFRMRDTPNRWVAFGPRGKTSVRGAPRESRSDVLHRIFALVAPDSPISAFRVTQCAGTALASEIAMIMVDIANPSPSRSR